MNTYIFWDNTLSNRLPVSIISHGLEPAILYYIDQDSRTLEQLQEIYGESKYNELQLKFIDLFDRLNSEDMFIFMVDSRSYKICSPLKNISHQAFITMKNMVEYQEDIGLNQKVGLNPEDLK